MAHRVADIEIQRALLESTGLRRPYGLRLLPSGDEGRESTPKLPEKETTNNANDLAPAELFAITTEHSTLQAQRSSTVFETGVRSALFLGAVSGGLVALAFVGQVSASSAVFGLFALVVIPALLVLGVLTHLRLVELAIEDAHYGRAINRVRHYYFDMAPQSRRYFLMSAQDDMAGVTANTGRPHTRWHFLTHAATMILIVTSILAGVSAGLAAHLLVSASLGLSAGVGGAALLVAAAALARQQTDTWRRAERATRSRFPSPTARGSR